MVAKVSDGEDENWDVDISGFTQAERCSSQGVVARRRTDGFSGHTKTTLIN